MGWTVSIRSSGQASRFRARAPSRNDWTGARPQVLAVLPTTVPSLQPTGWTEDRSPGSRTLRNERFVADPCEPLVELPQKTLRETTQEPANNNNSNILGYTTASPVP